MKSQAKIYSPGSFKLLIDEYRASKAFQELSARTKQVYDVHLKRLASVETWGTLSAQQLTVAGVNKARDALSETPGMANQMLAVGRTLYAWALSEGLVNSNPFALVTPLEMAVRGHVPWPRFILEKVLSTAPEDLRRNGLQRR